jgi:hypothetical protein
MNNLMKAKQFVNFYLDHRMNNELVLKEDYKQQQGR